MCTPKGVCLCSQHRAPLYCILRLAASKKAELRVAGVGEKGGCQHTAELQGAPPDPSCPGLAETFRRVPGFLGPHGGGPERVGGVGGSRQ